MVVFTCSHCGESLQKPKVQKHYDTVCRRSMKSLTCVDCLKDFKGDEYEAHTKCVTEDQRYAPKGANSTPTVKKGEAKQESWIEVVKNVVKNAGNVPNGQKQVLEVMSNSANVPRKQKKFVNFIISATGKRVKSDDITAVWNMVENYKSAQLENSKQQEESQEANVESETAIKPKNKKRKSKDSGIDETAEVGQKTGIEDPVPCDTINKTEDITLTKKRKSKSDDTNSITETPKTKKHKKHNTVEADADTVHVEMQTNGMADKPVRKRKSKGDDDNSVSTDEPSKSKKHKNQKTEQEAVEMPINGIADAEITEDKSVKKRKSKRKDSKVNDEAVAKKESTEISTNVTEALLNKPSKKHKHKGGENEQISNTEANENGTVTECKTAGVPNGTEDKAAINEFSIAEQILKVVGLTNTISVEKLQSKVLKAYCKKTGVEVSAKLIKKFNKKLKKLNGVEIKDNVVSLVK